MGPSGKWIEGIGPDSSVEEAARRSLEARLTAVNYWLPLAAYLSEQDIEHVHRLRVGTRRASAALKLFRGKLSPKPAHWLNKKLKQARRAAGAARDLDVLAERLVREYGQRRTAPVAELIQHARGELQPAIVRIAERCRRRDRFLRKTAKLLTALQPNEDESSPQERFADWATERLVESAEEFFAAAPGDACDHAALHRFRICGKGLRYTIELVAPAFGRELRTEVYPEIEELQARLGKIQDHVAGASRLNDWSEKAKDLTQQNALRELAAEESARLDDEVGEFRDWWTAERLERLRRSLLPRHPSESTTALARAAAQM